MTLMTLLHLSTVRTPLKTTLYTVYMGASVISVMEVKIVPGEQRAAITGTAGRPTLPPTRLQCLQGRPALRERCQPVNLLPHETAYNPNCKTSGHKYGHNRRMFENNTMKTNMLHTYSPSVTNRLMLKCPVNTRFYDEP
jgi:hypothetical protein